MSKRKMKG
jgi:hypothetical protein